ncbi:hypothetical protein LD112_19895 [Pantoea agglomerans]|nr:hypothetical protein [Pantoea agglomerans]
MHGLVAIFPSATTAITSAPPWASQPLDTPKHYKEMKRFARVKWHQKQYAESLSWMMKYVSLKFFKQSEQ